MKCFIRILSLLLIILMTAVLPSCSEDGVTVSLGGRKIYTDSPAPAMQQQSASGKTKISLKNNSDKDVALIIYTASDTPRIELDCKAGESAAQSAVFEKTDCAVDGIAVFGESVSAYVFTAAGLTAALNDADSVYLLNDIEISGDLTLNRPSGIHTASHTLAVDGSIFLTSGDNGDFLLDGSILADGLFADAPLCSITVPEALVPENISRNIVARAINGVDIDTVRTVSSEDELSAITKDGAYPSVKPDSVLVLRDFEICKPHTFTVPLSLHLKNVTFSAPISFDTVESGTIAIDGAADAEYININAPKCDIKWEECPYTVFEAAEEYTALSLNGISLDDVSLGGAEEKELKISLDNGKNMTGSITWQRTAPYTYTAVITSPTAPSALGGVQLDISVSSGDTVRDILYDSFCSDGEVVDLLSKNGASFVLDGARYRLITKSDCRLPVVVIDTGGTPVTSRDEYIDATVSVESNFSADGMPSLDTTEVSIAGRGNTTWNWSNKKPYKLKFETNTSVLGMAAAKNWVLLANFADKSLIRNYVALEAAKTLDKIDCYATEYPVDVFMGGEYIGVYTMGEKVETGDGRAYIRDDGISVDSGYLLEMNGSDSGDDGIDVIKGSSLGVMRIVYPGSRLTPAQSEYIKNYIGIADTAVTKNHDPSQYIDFESFADFILMLELSYNSDSCFRRSVFLAKDAGGPLRVSQMWDFDLAFGNSIADGSYEEWATLADYGYVKTTWSRPLLSNEKFLAVLNDRWEKNKDALLEAALSAVDHGEYLVAPSAGENFKKWDIMYLYVGMQPEASYPYHTFEDQVEYLREFIISRWNWIDSEIGNLGAE